jgi:SAM-dependent methyltransferase
MRIRRAVPEDRAFARGAAPKWDPDAYQRNAAFVAELGEPLLRILAPRPGERVLDLGCGDGRLTLALVKAGCSVVGVDSSRRQVAAARRRGLDARVVNGEALAFSGEFDAVLSNAALHWMRRPRRVLRGVWKALRPGGRFVAELGGRGNAAAVARAIARALRRRGLRFADLSPWYFPGPREYRRLLREAGFRVMTLETFARPTRLPGDIVAWLETFGGAFLEAVPKPQRAAFSREVREALVPALQRADGWYVDYVRLRFHATKPPASHAPRVSS